MDMKGGGGGGGGGENDETTTTMRSRSFRNEDYNTRRVFLRSYPLQWGDEEEEQKEAAGAVAGAGVGREKKVKEETTAVKGNDDGSEGMGMKGCMKKIVMAAFQWRGERGLVLRKFKHKFTLYFVTCVPVGFKAPAQATLRFC